MIKVLVGFAIIVLASLDYSPSVPSASAQELDAVPAAEMSVDEEVAFVTDAIRSGAQTLVCPGGPGSPYCNWCLSGGCHGNTVCFGVCQACCH